MLGIIYVFVDILQWFNGAPCVYIGMNSILVYCGHEILQGYFPFSMSLHPLKDSDFDGEAFGSHTAALVSAIIGVSCWMIIAFWLYKKKIFVKV